MEWHRTPPYGRRDQRALCADRGDHRLRHAGDAPDHPGAARHGAGTRRLRRRDPAHHHAVPDRSGDRAVAVRPGVRPVRSAAGAAGGAGAVHAGRHRHDRGAECLDPGDRAHPAVDRRVRRFGAGAGDRARFRGTGPRGGAARIADPGDVGSSRDRAGAGRLRHRVDRLARRVRAAGDRRRGDAGVRGAAAAGDQRTAVGHARLAAGGLAAAVPLARLLRLRAGRRVHHHVVLRVHGGLAVHPGRPAASADRARGALLPAADGGRGGGRAVGQPAGRADQGTGGAAPRQFASPSPARRASCWRTSPAG